MPTFGSLFSGIGGLDLGLQRAGWECRWQVEIDPWCRRVLEKHWPDVPKYEDVRLLNGSDLEPVDLICGGFPCQPVSLAGKGLAQADPRWLWPEFARAIRQVRPRLVLVENVPGLRGRGLGDVLGDLAACGYDAEWDCIPASALGAHHQRDRLWLVAYAQRTGPQTCCRDGLRTEQGSREGPVACAGRPELAHTASDGRVEGRAPASEHLRWAGGGSAAVGNAHRSGSSEREERVVLVQQPSPERAGWWAVEPDVGRVANGVPGRVDRLRGLGNAVVPQVAEWLGQRLLEAFGNDD
jgi:DNA (cytosine-5)-methyltransferase 1